MSFVFQVQTPPKIPQKEVSKLIVGDIILMTRGQEFQIQAIEDWEGFLTLTVTDCYGKASKITKRPEAFIGIKKAKK